MKISVLTPDLSDSCLAGFVVGKNTGYGGTKWKSSNQCLDLPFGNPFNASFDISA